MKTRIHLFPCAGHLVQMLSGIVLLWSVSSVMAEEKEAPARDAVFGQTLVDKVWLYEIAIGNKPDGKGKEELLRSYCGYMFQLFELQEIAKEDSAVLERALRAVAASDLTKLAAKYFRDPLNIKMFYDDEGKMESPSEQRFSLIIETEDISTWSKYQEVVERFNAWLAELNGRIAPRKPRK